ncbi:16S rRNA (guanine(527)-N(7))-methyltransferase RsmG [Roseomonas sp. OT10]|uniref:16S rRNA (guanine(527)-N(7))-methyltransferase RsmG n=1 Tax=Roseomonas cutis TaxID=2897332 RepID=UPI001E28A46A|nr:16S rRNA (guanine(527)-N(7))-methyltransferase RsmG [Roseomonas sp. OT10]UFN48590.1 16S rRNA (guanine(527)-N(7))-methyltransferase RsmG [Roseomonas sp. OT10]
MTPVSRETAGRLDAYAALLLRWNARINLIAPGDAAQFRQRHVEDSLQLLPLLPAGTAPGTDIGSGGGLPGMVLALADPRRPWHLVEADRRKAAFLQTVAGELEAANVSVHARRIEDVSLPPLGVLTARALAPLDILLGHAARLLAPGGTALFPKGRTAEAELTQAAATWTMTTERFPSRTDPSATLLRITGIRRVGP